MASLPGTVPEIPSIPDSDGATKSQNAAAPPLQGAAPEPGSVELSPSVTELTTSATIEKLVMTLGKDKEGSRDSGILLGILLAKLLDGQSTEEKDTLRRTFNKVFEEQVSPKEENKDEEKAIQDDLTSTYLMIPIVNVLYDALFPAPSPARLRGLLDIVGMLAALMLSVVVSVSMNVDFYEFEQAKQRFNVTPYNSVTTFDELLQEVTGYYTASTYCLGATVFLVVVVVASEGLETTCKSFVLRNEWWNPCGFLIVLGIILQCVFGIAFAVFGYNRMFYIKYPDIWVEQHANGVRWPSLYGSTYGATTSWATFHMTPSLVVAIVLISVGKMRMVRYAKSHQIEELTIGEETYWT